MWWLVALWMPSHFMYQCKHIVQWTFLNKVYVRLWYEPFIAYVWHCQGLHWGLLPFRLVKIDTCDGSSPERWQAITWTTADLLFIETFWTNSGFTLLKPSLLWSATFIKTSLSRNLFHTAGPLCGDPISHWWDLFTGISSVGVSLGVSLNNLYDVMEVIPVLLTPCAGNHKHQWIPLINVRQWGFSFDASVNKLLNKQVKWHQSQILFYAHVTSL